MLKDRLIFFKKFLQNPLTIGSVTPSSNFLAQEIYKIVSNQDNLDNIIEFGPGTGAITAYLKNLNPYLIELDHELVKILKNNFPQLSIEQGCCLNFLANNDNKIGLIISIPLISGDFKKKFILAMQKQYQQGCIDWCIIYSYGFKNPLAGVGFKHQSRKLVLQNIPPAHLWLYK